MQQRPFSKICPFPSALATTAIVMLVDVASLSAQATDTSKTGDTKYGTGAIVIVIIALAVVALLFYLLLKWQQRQEAASYLGTVYRETVEQIEYQRLTASLSQSDYRDEVIHDPQWLASNAPPTPPQGLRRGTRNPFDDDDVGRVPLPHEGGMTPRPSRTGSGIGSSERQERDPKEMASEVEYYHLREEWSRKVDDEVWKRYQAKLRACRKEAQEQAARASGDVDLAALRGRGAEFVLGFTTIASIVFAALALGVLKVLNTEQIGTLFAAIAGYVLGRTTARGSPEVQREQPVPTQRVPEAPQPSREGQGLARSAKGKAAA